MALQLSTRPGNEQCPESILSLKNPLRLHSLDYILLHWESCNAHCVLVQLKLMCACLCLLQLSADCIGLQGSLTLTRLDSKRSTRV